MTSTLAYYGTELIMNVNKFYEIGPKGKIIMPMLDVLPSALDAIKSFYSGFYIFSNKLERL